FEVFNRDVEDALALLSEQCFQSTVPAERFAKEQRVVIDEIRGRQEDPANYVHEHAWARFFGDGLGHPVCGSVSSVRGMTRQAVRGFIARHFVPANMCLALVGGVTRDAIRRALGRAFPRGVHGMRSRPARARPRTTGLDRARNKWRSRFARLADSRLDRALAHASRAACDQPSLAATERMIARLRPAEVEAAWRRALAAPTLTAVLRG